MRSNILIEISLAATIFSVLPSAGAASGRDSIFIFGAGTADQAAESKFGCGMASGIKDQLAIDLAMELDKQYPCHGSLTMSDLRDLLDLARMRELLGENSEKQMEALTSVSGAVGARYAVEVRVRIIGGQVFVSTMIDISRSRTVARDTATFAIRSRDS